MRQLQQRHTLATQLSKAKIRHVVLTEEAKRSFAA
jgi:hypothetical protein